MNTIISPWSRGDNNAKNYPYWNKLVFGLATRGWKITQVGVGNEYKIPGCDYVWDSKLVDIEKLTLDVGYFIAVDNFFHHMAYSLGVKGVVLWGPSDPELFGYPTQVNILKSRDWLRKDQFGYYKDYKWEHAQEGWYEAEEVLRRVLSEGQSFSGQGVEISERSKETGVSTVESA